jgi:hypothetical protein
MIAKSRYLPVSKKREACGSLKSLPSAASGQIFHQEKVKRAGTSVHNAPRDRLLKSVRNFNRSNAVCPLPTSFYCARW